MLECILNEIMTKKKKRILIIRCGLLGDTIDSTAVVKPLVDHYGQRLEKAGFKVTERDFINELDPKLVERYALPKGEIIYFCEKKV